jgi:hypothetical protein
MEDAADERPDARDRAADGRVAAAGLASGVRKFSENAIEMPAPSPCNAGDEGVERLSCISATGARSVDNSRRSIRPSRAARWSRKIAARRSLPSAHLCKNTRA